MQFIGHSSWEIVSLLFFFPTTANTVCHVYRPSLSLQSSLCAPAGLLRLKGAYDPTPDLEEMKSEKEKADREPRVSILSLVGLCTRRWPLEIYSVPTTSSFFVSLVNLAWTFSSSILEKMTDTVNGFQNTPWHKGIHSSDVKVRVQDF